MLRRPARPAGHACFLLIKAQPGDQGVRPVPAPFATAAITEQEDGRPQVLVWNLGARTAEGVVTEFYTIPAGRPVDRGHAALIGLGKPAIIPAGQAVPVTCTEPWRRTSPADVLLVMAYHPTQDPLIRPFDAMADRHVGQMNYPWAGRYEGHLGQEEPRRVVIDLRPASQRLFRLRLFEEADGRMGTYPRCDRVMKPNGHAFRWLEAEGEGRVLFDLVLRDNDRLQLSVQAREGGAGPESGLLTRVFSPEALREINPFG